TTAGMGGAMLGLGGASGARAGRGWARAPRVTPQGPGAAPPPASRPLVLGTHGMVSTGHPLASAAALRLLQDGGQAVDAVMAATGVLGVVRPFASTIGGDLFALVHDGASGEVVALNASGPAPQAATSAWYRAQGHRTIPNTGLLSIEAPGLVD